MLRWILGAIIGLCLAGAAAAEEKRLALLIGNAGYSEAVGPLKNPHNDIVAIREALITAEFEAGDIRVLTDVGRIDLLRAVNDFAARAEGLGPDDIAFFYYSGHGARRPGGRGMSLIPTDVSNVEDDGFWFETVSLEQEVIAAFEGERGDRARAAWVVAIDACRNELRLPQRALGGGAKAFGVVPASSGMLISYAADTGETAADTYGGGAALSPYAQALSQEIVRPGRTLSAIFSAVRPVVRDLTGAAQEPVSISRLNRDPVLLASRSPNTPRAPPAAVVKQSGQCEAGDASACSSLGILYAEGLGVARDYGEASRLYRRACEGGDAFGCTTLGTLYDLGRGVKQDSLEAARLYRIGCDAGEAAACTLLGILRANSGEAADVQDARRLYETACAAGEAAACSNLGRFYQQGRGVARDDARARSLFEQSCDGGFPIGCTRLAHYYYRGRAVPLDYERAHTLYLKACRDGDPEGCDGMAELQMQRLGDPDSYVVGFALIQSSCDGGYMRSCASLGVLFQEGLGVAVSTVEARRAYHQACDGGEAVGCTNLGLLYQQGLSVPADAAEARRLYRQGCQGGDARGCSILGFIYETGLDVARDESEGAEFHRLGCKGGDERSCDRLRTLGETP